MAHPALILTHWSLPSTCQSIGVGKDVLSAGYHIPKWGNVAMTKVFGTATHPAPDLDGVKAYAIAPSFAGTALGK